MRTLMIVFLSITAGVGILAGGAMAGFRYFSDEAKDIKAAEEMVSTWRQNAKNLDAEGEKELADLEAKVMTGRVYGMGGLAVFILSVALLVTVLVKKGGVPVFAGLGIVTAIVLVVLAPGKEKKGILALSVPVGLAAICGFVADRARPKAAPLPG